jgi:hypothetical protein
MQIATKNLMLLEYTAPRESGTLVREGRVRGGIEHKP